MLLQQEHRVVQSTTIPTPYNATLMVRLNHGCGEPKSGRPGIVSLGKRLIKKNTTAPMRPMPPTNLASTAAEEEAHAR